jgi:hypothetical protein
LTTIDSVVRARYLSGRAEVWVGDRPLQVERRDEEDRTYGCPIEFVTAALSS